MEKYTASFFRIFCFVIFTSFCPAQQPATPDTKWQTKEFQVLWYSPYYSDQVYELKELVEKGGPTDDEKLRWSLFDSHIKRSLTEIATFFEANKLKEPFLPIETQDGVKRWTIYAYAFKSGWIVDETEKYAAGFYDHDLCPDNSVRRRIPRRMSDKLADPILAFDIGKLENAKLPQLDISLLPDLYDSLAHELFHAIQATYDREHSSFLRCSLPEKDTSGDAPLSEGTATAASYFAAMNKYPDADFVRGSDDISIGAFPYGRLDFLRVPRDLSGPGVKLPYQTSSFWAYLAEKYGGLRVFDVLFKTPLKVTGEYPTAEERYKWLDGATETITGKRLYLVLPEFFAELSSWFETKYADFYRLPTRTPSDWDRMIFRGGSGPCHRIRLSDVEATDSFELTGASGFRGGLGATCINLEWSEINSDFKIEVQASSESSRVADQLHLGVSRLSTDGREDQCYSWTRSMTEMDDPRLPKKFELKDLDCSFGQPFLKISDIEKAFIKTNTRVEWELGWPPTINAFFSRKLGSSGKATLILSNVALEPGTTLTAPQINLPDDKIIVRFTVRKIRFADGRKFDPPKQLEGHFPGGIPTEASLANLAGAFPTGPSVAGLSSGPDRYAFYGIVKGERIVPIKDGLGFRTASASNPERAYNITPFSDSDFKYGKTGPFFAIVANDMGASSAICDEAKNQTPNANIVRSDESQLRFTIKTDVCVIDLAAGGMRRIDSFEAEVVLPFGDKYFREAAPSDRVTPGLELYIDQYLKKMAALGIPIPGSVRLLDGTHPGGVGSSGKPGPGGKGRPVSDCDCSCDGIERTRKTLEEAKRTNSKDTKLLSEVACVQKCIPQMIECRKNRPKN